MEKVLGWNGVENLCIYMAFFIQHWSLKNMEGILSDFVYKQCILGFRMKELIDTTQTVAGQVYINVTLHSHGQAMIKNKKKTIKLSKKVRRFLAEQS